MVSRFLPPADHLAIHCRRRFWPGRFAQRVDRPSTSPSWPGSAGSWGSGAGPRLSAEEMLPHYEGASRALGAGAGFAMIRRQCWRIRGPPPLIIKAAIALRGFACSASRLSCWSVPSGWAVQAAQRQLGCGWLRRPTRSDRATPWARSITGLAIARRPGVHISRGGDGLRDALGRGRGKKGQRSGVTGPSASPQTERQTTVTGIGAATVAVGPRGPGTTRSPS